MANLLFSFRRLKQNKKKEKKTKIAYLAILWQRTYSLGCVCLCLFHVQLNTAPCIPSTISKSPESDDEPTGV
jgi:hypothetical protein